MSHPIQWYADKAQLHFLTIRCLRAMFLLRPDPAVNQIVGLAIARAVEQTGVSLYVAVAMSSHLHLIVSGKADAIRHFKRRVYGNIAKWVNRFRKLSGRFWHRRGSSSAILSEPFNWDKLIYTLLNPVTAGLCARAADWIGFITLPENLGAEPRVYEYLDLEKYNQARRRDPNVSKEEFITRHPLKVTPLPEFAGDPEGFAVALKEALAQHEDELAKERRQAGRRVLTPRQILERPFTSSSPNPKQGKRPLCHGTKELCDAYREAYREYCAVYKTASKDFRDGKLTTPFPEGCFRPQVASAIRVVLLA